MTPEPSNEYQKLVEAVARAMAVSERADPDKVIGPDLWTMWQEYADLARAALSALKLPHAGDDGWQDIAELKPEFGEVLGWLIEEDAGGFIHWIALASDAWPRYDVKTIARTADYEMDREKYRSPVERVKDSNDAIRFARKEDAEAFIRLFDRFLLCPKATEHCWRLPTPPAKGTPHV